MRGGTLVDESAKFLINVCFSQKKFNNKKFNANKRKQKVVSNHVSTSYETTKHSHKTYFSYGKNSHISRLCSDKKSQINISKSEKGINQST